MVKFHKRPIMAQLHRRSGNSTSIIWTRYYVKVSTALRRAVEIALESSHPGDVIEFSHSNHGFQIATVKISFNKKGKLDLHFEVEEFFKDFEKC